MLYNMLVLSCKYPGQCKPSKNTSLPQNAESMQVSMSVQVFYAETMVWSRGQLKQAFTEKKMTPNTTYFIRGRETTWSVVFN